MINSKNTYNSQVNGGGGTNQKNVGNGKSFLNGNGLVNLNTLTNFTADIDNIITEKLDSQTF